MNKELERLLRLNRNMDALITEAKIETDKMKEKVEELKFSATTILLDTLRDIKPAMDVICSSLRVNEYQEKMIFSKKHDAYWKHILLSYGNPGGTNYGMKIIDHDLVIHIWEDEFTVVATSYKIYEEDTVINGIKEFIAEHFEDIIDAINNYVKKILLETMENKARKQVELQRELQDKMNKFGGKE